MLVNVGALRQRRNGPRLQRDYEGISRRRGKALATLLPVADCRGTVIPLSQGVIPSRARDLKPQGVLRSRTCL